MTQQAITLSCALFGATAIGLLFRGEKVEEANDQRTSDFRDRTAPSKSGTAPKPVDWQGVQVGHDWIEYTTPQNPGDPGLDTWPNLDAARNGGGQVWVPGVYDPETNYYIFGTGNPTPGYTGVARAGDNLLPARL